jgi:hypothetical protein
MCERQGFRTVIARGALTDETLSGVNALVLSGPFTPYTTEEVEAIVRFVDRGGRVAIMLHIGPPLAGLLERFGVSYSTRPVHVQDQVIDGDSRNFRVTRLAPHPLNGGLESFSMYGAWALLNRSDRAAIISRTGPDAWVDLNGDGRLSDGDAIQSFGVVVAGEYGRGGFVVFGDDAIFQNRFLDADNRRLAGNLIAWLKPVKII